MACLNPDGTLTVVAAAVLGALEADGLEEAELAAAAALPLWRLRASLRELAGAGLLADRTGCWNMTEKGREVLALSRELDGD